MKYKIWNKIDSINGVESNYILKKYKVNSNDSIFLVIDDYNNVIELQFVNIIKSVYSLPNTLTDEEVAQEYLRIKEEDQQKQKEEIENKLTQQDEIDALKKQNAELMYMMMQNQGGMI